MHIKTERKEKKVGGGKIEKKKGRGREMWVWNKRKKKLPISE